MLLPILLLFTTVLPLDMLLPWPMRPAVLVRLQQLMLMRGGWCSVLEVMKVTQSGGYEKHVVALIKLLAKKGKLGLLDEVMAEFSKICDKLTGTKVVTVGPSKSRRDATEFERIAREVQRTSGANRVKVRHVLSI
ncbi:ATP synthase delta chain [Carex littledalei]|uniref:ATP synthase delta chain n=1 Tax=Carex littledalei TaxID=544730 RepID=A0A833RBM1_9POAL|nr:ATP synthase delta chain [Carex littledalei]